MPSLMALMLVSPEVKEALGVATSAMLVSAALGSATAPRPPRPPPRPPRPAAAAAGAAGAAAVGAVWALTMAPTTAPVNSAAETLIMSDFFTAKLLRSAGREMNNVRKLH